MPNSSTQSAQLKSWTARSTSQILQQDLHSRSNTLDDTTAISPLPLEFVTGRSGPRKTRAPGPFPRPAPLNRLGLGVFFGIPCPCPHSGPRPTHSPDGSALKMGGNKRGPVYGMSAGGPRAGAGRGLPYKYPPRPHVRAGPGE